MGAAGYETFEDVKARLDEIVEAVSDDDLPLDEALVLYEEAVGLGLRASDLIEEGIEARSAGSDAPEAPDAAAGPDAPEVPASPAAPEA